MTLKIAGIQMIPRLMENECNLDQILSYLEIVAKEGAELAIFPECALCGYCFESLEEALPYAEPIPGPSTLKVAVLCNRLTIHAVLGLLEKEGDHIFNAAVLIGPQGIVGKYRKIHLPGLGVDKYVQPGILASLFTTQRSEESV